MGVCRSNCWLAVTAAYTACVDYFWTDQLVLDKGIICDIIQIYIGLSLIRKNTMIMCNFPLEVYSFGSEQFSGIKESFFLTGTSVHSDRKKVQICNAVGTNLRWRFHWGWCWGPSSLKTVENWVGRFCFGVSELFSTISFCLLKWEGSAPGLWKMSCGSPRADVGTVLWELP